MANVFNMKVLQEGPRNAVVKLTGILDSGDLTAPSVVALSDFHNNDQNQYLTGFRIDFVEFSMSTGLEINLWWNSNTPEQITPLAGRGRFGSKNYGGLYPDPTRAGYDGSLNMSTTGASGGTFVTGQTANFTVILELVKLYNTNSNIPGQI